MALYAPLRFINQMENYIRLSNDRVMETVINENSMKWSKDYMEKNRSRVFHDYGMLRDIGEIDNTVIDSYSSDYIGMCTQLGLAGSTIEVNDFFDLMVYYDIRDIWRRNKLSYIVDTELFETLVSMETPKLAPVDCMAKLPANCFYVDYNGRGDEFIKDLEGTFIITDSTDSEINLILVHLVNSKTLSRVLYVTSVYRLPAGDHDKFISEFSGANPVTLIDCEDGIKRLVHEKKFYNFLCNFLIYLHAANRDVEVSERTRKNHEVEHTEIKNKFREVKEFEVGFVYGRSIRKGATRIKYVGEGEQEAGVGSPKASHYRSAHWHHFWTGSGENKELIIKWVEGVFVNGGKGEVENVRVHKVE